MVELRSGVADLTLGSVAFASFRQAWKLRRSSREQGQPISEVIAAAVMTAPLALGCFISAHLRRQSMVERFGLRPERTDPLWMVGSMLGAQALAVLPQLAASRLPPLPPRPPANTSEPRAYDAYAPLVEEMMFRGLLQGGATALLPAPLAVLAQGVFFGALHVKTPSGLDVKHGLEAACMGTAMGAAVALNRNRLLPTILAHYAFNTLGPIVAGRAQAKP